MPRSRPIITWTDALPLFSLTASVALAATGSFVPAAAGLVLAAVARTSFATVFPSRVTLGSRRVGLSSSTDGQLVGYREVVLTNSHASAELLQKLRPATTKEKSRQFTVSLFFPVSPLPKRNIDRSRRSPAWLPHALTASGTAAYAGLPAFLFGHWSATKMSVVEGDADATTLLDAATIEERRIFVVSHGLSGHRNVSSILCQNLALRGGIVLSIGHEDGSGAYGENARQLYTPPPAEDGEANGFPRRNEQLLYRMGEVEAVVDFVKSGGLARELSITPARNDDKTTVGRGGGSMTFIGHSFGAATGLCVASKILYHKARTTRKDEGGRKDTSDETRLSDLLAVSFSKFILFDAWMCPINIYQLFGRAPATAAGGDDEDRSREASPFSVTFVDSEQWVRWKSNRAKEDALIDVLNNRCPANASPTTADAVATRVDVMGTDHMSPTDMAVLLPYFGRKRGQYKKTWRADGEAVLAEWADLCFSS